MRPSRGPRAIATLSVLLCLPALEARGAEPPRKLSEQELTALLDRLEAKLGQVSSLRADFTQKRHLSLFTDVVRSEGALLFARPDAVRFETTRPFQSVLIAAGRSVAKYEFLDGRWQKLKPGGGAAAMRLVTEQIATWLGGKLRCKADAYELSATADADAVTITLAPRHERLRQFIAAIELTLNRNETHFDVVTVREPGGDLTRMLFKHPKHDVELPKGVFDTTGATPPPLPGG